MKELNKQEALLVSGGELVTAGIIAGYSIVAGAVAYGAVLWAFRK